MKRISQHIFGKKWMWLFLLGGYFLLLFFFVTFPFYHDGFFQISDDVQVVRIEKMAEELRGGQFPVRYVDSLGNTGGYMLFNFYSPFVYYVGAAIYLLGFPLVQTVKIVFLLGYFVGLTGIIVLLKRYADWLSVGIGTTLFMTASYIGYDVFFRGALAEFFGFMLLPWLFVAFLRLKLDVSHMFRDGVIAAGLYALLIVTHNITAYIATFFLFLLFVLPPFKRAGSIRFIFAGLCGIFLSAFYWIPHLTEQQYIIYDTTFLGGQVYKTTFATPVQLAAIFQNGAGRYPMLGVGLMLGSIMACIQGVIALVQKRQIPPLLFFSAVSFLGALFLMWDISLFVWDFMPFLRNVQFPWRFLTIATLMSVLLTTFFVAKLSRWWYKLFFAALFLLPVITWYYHYIRPTTYTYVAAYKPEDVCATTTWDQELLPKWVSVCLPTKKPLPLVIADTKSKITQLDTSNNGRTISFTTTGGQNTITIAKYYYPGWQAVIGDTKVPITAQGKHGLITFQVPQGKHHIVVSYHNTWGGNAGNIVSLGSFICISVIYIFDIRKKKGKYIPFRLRYENS